MILERTVKEQVAKAALRPMNLQGLMINVLATGWEVDAQQLTMCAGTVHIQVEERLGQAADPMKIAPVAPRSPWTLAFLPTRD